MRPDEAMIYLWQIVSRRKEIIEDGFTKELFRVPFPKQSNPNYQNLLAKKKKSDLEMHEAYQFLMKQFRVIPK